MHAKISALDTALRMRCGYGVSEYIKVAGLHPESDKSYAKKLRQWENQDSEQAIARHREEDRRGRRRQRVSQAAMTGLSAVGGGIVGSGAAQSRFGARARVPGALAGALGGGAAAALAFRPHSPAQLKAKPRPVRGTVFKDEGDPWNNPDNAYHHDGYTRYAGKLRDWKDLSEPERKSYWEEFIR
jgi:hypothetical protein